MNTKHIDQVFRTEAGRALATLIRLLGDFDLAEEALQEALASALEAWPGQAAPLNPRAWLVQVGRRKAIDRLRRQSRFAEQASAIAFATAPAADTPSDDDGDQGAVDDDMLRLIFTCCHPALGPEMNVALTLRSVCGLTTEAVARAFLVATETMAQRLVRAKRKIRVARIPYQTPQADLLDDRIDSVLAVVYLVFTQGYAGTCGPSAPTNDFAAEAIRLSRLLDGLLPGRSAIQGLRALLLLQDARRAARTDANGDIVLLDDQDRALWDQDQIREGLAVLDAALAAGGHPNPYVVQAAIAALHTRASHRDMTDWRQIVGLYEILVRISPSPVVELNHAAAASMVDGPARGLALLDALAARGGLGTYHLLPAARAGLLRQLDRRDEACVAYRQAWRLTSLEPERRLFAARLAELGSAVDTDD